MDNAAGNGLGAATEQRPENCQDNYGRHGDKQHRTDGEGDAEKDETKDDERCDGPQYHAKGQQPCSPTRNDGRPPILLNDEHAGSSARGVGLRLPWS